MQINCYAYTIHKILIMKELRSFLMLVFECLLIMITGILSLPCEKRRYVSIFVLLQICFNYFNILKVRFILLDTIAVLVTC